MGMIYLKMHGRLGNQFFQYAYAATLAAQRKDDIVIDFSEIYNFAKKFPGDGWENALQYFNIKQKVVLGKVKYSFIQKFLCTTYKGAFYLLRQLVSELPAKKRFVISERAKFLLEEMFLPVLAKDGIFIAMGFYDYDGCQAGNLILSGNFESERYFEHDREELQREYMPRHKLLDANKIIYREIIDSESVCVSIRRGDYISNTEVKAVADVCSPAYFYQGIRYIQERIPAAKFIIFSDDISWVKKNMCFPAGTRFESGRDPVWEKLRLMSACKHFIISNSTFSWWAQYLGTNPKKIVVAPDKWRKYGYDGHALYEKGWILIAV